MNTFLKNLLRIVGGLLILAGAVWILQGTNVLPGSYMTGDPQWTINGAVTAILGVALIWFSNRKK